MDDIKGNIEEEIVRLEEKGIIWNIILYLILLGLIGLNAHLHSEEAKGIYYFIFVFLISAISKNITKDFFGAAQIAIYIILHISLFGIQPVALIATFLIFALFIRVFKKNSIIPISIYLLIDSLSTYVEVEKMLLPTLKQWGEEAFTSPIFYSIILFIPLHYAYIQYERYLRKIFNNSFLNRFGSFILLGLIMLVTFPIAYLYDFEIFAYIAGAAMILYITGMTMRQSQDGRTDNFKRMNSGCLVRVGIIIIITIELIILKIIKPQ